MTVLDRKDKHSGPEPRVVTDDVKHIIEVAIDPQNLSSNKTVELIAEESNVSTRTVYRVLQNHTDSISLSLADRLCIAAGSHVQNCKLIWPTGEETQYYE